MATDSPLALFDPLLALLALTVAGFVFAFVPARIRLRAALVALPIWFTLGMLQDLGVVSAAAKATEVVVLLWLAGAAAMHPDRRAGLPRLTLVQLGLAALWMVAMLSVTEPVAVVLRLQWLLVIVAAALVARLPLISVLGDLALGCALAELGPLAALAVDPLAAFRVGLGRFFPFGSNPNHIGLLLAMATALSLYMAARQRRNLWLVSAGLGAGMTVLTGSRSCVLVLAVLCLPSLLQRGRRALALGAVGALLGGALLLQGVAEEGAPSTDHLESLDTDRVAIAEAYLTGPIAKRLLTGLIGTRNESALQDDTIGTHPHNAYLEALYHGGILLAAPLVLLLIVSLLCALRRQRREPSLEAALLLATLVAVTLHGFVNGAMYYPTYPWAFLHLLAASSVQT